MARKVSPDQEKSFHILGVIHRDNNNKRIVGEWLNKIRPQVVTLEFSQYGLTFRKERGPLYRKKIKSVLAQMRRDGETCNEEALSFLNAYIDIPSEYEAASLYCDENGAPLYLVDMGLFSFIKLKNTDEVFNEINIRNIARTRDICSTTNERFLARLFFDSGIQTIPYTEEMRVRDRYMSRRISKVLQDHKGMRVAHITGWRHLNDPCHFFTPFHPVKVFPYD